MENRFSQIPFLAVKTFKSGKYELKSLEGTINLSAWQGFQSRQGPYNSFDGNSVSDGSTIMIVGEYVSSEELLSISPEQVNAYEFTVEQQGRIKESILNALLLEYKQLQMQYGYEDDDESMPIVTAASQFKNHIGLSRVHLLDICKEGFAYVGYEFGCSWDDEHGLGIMTHKERVIEIGAADTSFDTSIGEEDIDPKAAEEELKRYKNAPLIRHKKPWWKFW
jgi:hypothetical protein